MEHIMHTKIHVGLEKPVKILHVTDVHLTHSSDKDPEDQRELLKQRTETFYKEGGCPPLTPDDYFREAIALAERENALLVVTGDVIDLYSDGNMKAFHEIIDGHDMMFTPGGHETQRICRRTMEEEAPYPEEAWERLKAALPEFDLVFDNRIINGLNIITADSGFNYYPAETVARFEAELEKGLPMLVFSHVTINAQMLRMTESYHPNVRLTPEDYRISRRMHDALLHDPRVITTFTGHWHCQIEEGDIVIDGKTHYNTPGLFAGICRMIEVV